MFAVLRSVTKKTHTKLPGNWITNLFVWHWIRTIEVCLVKSLGIAQDCGLAGVTQELQMQYTQWYAHTYYSN